MIHEKKLYTAARDWSTIINMSIHFKCSPSNGLRSNISNQKYIAYCIVYINCVPVQTNHAKHFRISAENVNKKEWWFERENAKRLEMLWLFLIVSFFFFFSLVVEISVSHSSCLPPVSVYKIYSTMCSLRTLY